MSRSFAVLTKLVSSVLCDEQSNAEYGGIGFRDECWPEAESVRDQGRSCIEITLTVIALEAFTFPRSRSHLIKRSCPLSA